MLGIAVPEVPRGYSCWPCTREAKETDPGDLRDRVCPHWRIAPGILCLVASVIAIACSLIWQTPSLCLAFVPAAGCSTYLIYLGWDFQNLQTFAENNEKLAASVGDLETQNGQLKEANKQLTGNIEQFSTSLSGLQAENGTLKSSNSQLEASVNGLQGNVRQLEGVRSSLEIQLKAEMASLNILKTGLMALQSSAKDDHSTFAEKLKIFIDQVGLLQTTRLEFEAANTQVASQSASILEAAETLKTIFSEIRVWKDGEEVNRRLSITQDLGSQVALLKGQVGLLKGQLGEQSRQIEDMETVRAGFQQLLKELLEAASGLNQTEGALAEQVRRAAEAFQKFQLKSPPISPDKK
ncbi:hypothetical protein ACFLR2_01645 [Chlamydiota bacterium]